MLKNLPQRWLFKTIAAGYAFCTKLFAAEDELRIISIYQGIEV
jgi:hypothetical protein